MTDEQLGAIYDLFQWAPTSANTQPLRVVIVRSEEAKARLLPHIHPGNHDDDAWFDRLPRLDYDEVVTAI